MRKLWIRSRIKGHHVGVSYRTGQKISRRNAGNQLSCKTRTQKKVRKVNEKVERKIFDNLKKKIDVLVRESKDQMCQFVKNRNGELTRGGEVRSE